MMNPVCNEYPTEVTLLIEEIIKIREEDPTGEIAMAMRRLLKVWDMNRPMHLVTSNGRFFHD